MKSYYQIVRHENGQTGITCLLCNKTSWNPQDISYKYCGNCHEFLSLKAITESLTADRLKIEQQLKKWDLILLVTKLFITVVATIGWLLYMFYSLITGQALWNIHIPIWVNLCISFTIGAGIAAIYYQYWIDPLIKKKIERIKHAAQLTQTTQ